MVPNNYIRKEKHVLHYVFHISAIIETLYRISTIIRTLKKLHNPNHMHLIWIVLIFRTLVKLILKGMYFILSGKIWKPVKLCVSCILFLIVTELVWNILKAVSCYEITKMTLHDVCQVTWSVDIHRIITWHSNNIRFHKNSN